MDWFDTPKFRDHVEVLMQKHHAPGIAMAFVHNDRVASAAFGLATIDPPKECTTDTLFDIASASKSLTAASVGLLVADEKFPDVQWETPMSRILPEDFVLPTKELTDAVTVEDILTHRTGLGQHMDSYFGINSQHPDTAASITRNLRNLPTVAPLRTTYIYSNMLFTVATHLVEQCSKLPFADYLEERFFKPLGMDSSNLQPARAKAKGLGDRIATGYLWDKKLQEYRGFQPEDTPESNGAGSIITSVNDYIKYVQAMMNQTDPFTNDIYEGLIRARTISTPDYDDLLPFKSPGLVGAGWEIQYYRGHMIVSHDGGIPGFNTTHFFLPQAKFGGVLFGNAETAEPVIGTVVHEMIDEILQVPIDQRIDWDQEFTKRSESQDEEKDEREEVRQEFCSGIKESQPLELPLSTYTGKYWNVGYRGMEVQIKDGQLFIDASDRSSPFALDFEHVCDNTKFVVRLYNILDGWTAHFKGEFELEEGKVVKMGLHLDAKMKGLIWFDPVA